MKLTRHLLEQGMSRKGSWSVKQLTLLGVKPTGDKGWKHRVIGREYPVSVIGEFLSLKDAHLGVESSPLLWNTPTYEVKQEYVARGPIPQAIIDEAPFDIRPWKRRKQNIKSYPNLDAQIFIEKAERARKEREELEEIDRSFDLCVSDFEYSLWREK